MKCCDALHCRGIVTGPLPVKGGPLKGVLLFLCRCLDNGICPQKITLCYHFFLSNTYLFLVSFFFLVLFDNISLDQPQSHTGAVCLPPFGALLTGWLCVIWREWPFHQCVCMFVCVKLSDLIYNSHCMWAARLQSHLLLIKGLWDLKNYSTCGYRRGQLDEAGRGTSCLSESCYHKEKGKLLSFQRTHWKKNALSEILSFLLSCGD